MYIIEHLTVHFGVQVLALLKASPSVKVENRNSTTNSNTPTLAHSNTFWHINLPFNHMAACDPIVLSDISEEMFNRIKSDLSKAGFALTGTSGTVKGPFGIVFQYAWAESTKVLEIDIVEKSFFISCRQIQDQLYQALNKYA